MAWYNKYRPQQFSDVTGQTLVKSVLENALKKDRVKHAYLFYGPKGVGKTTLARIFAAGLNELDKNQEAAIDTIEMDAASNTSIDDIRQLIESAKTPPLIGKYKIYILDEVHMLSKAAMNALLKILEEPPIYLVFLMATTNPEKLIPTVLSRLTKLNLNSHSQQDIVTNLKYIAESENVKIDDNSLKLIAKRSAGSLRDAINLLETVASYELDTYTPTETNQLLGLLPIETLQNLAKSLLDSHSILPETISELETSGVDGETFLGQFLDFLLTASFEGDKSNDSLIIPVAEILNLKLPISSITSSIALVQVKLGSVNSSNGLAASKKNSEFRPIPKVDSILPQPQTPDPTTIFESEPLSHNINLEKSQPPTQSQDEISIPTDNVLTGDTSSLINLESESETSSILPADEIEAQSADHSSVQSNQSVSQISLESTERILGSLTQLSDAPPILKMMISDLSVESAQSEKIELGISNAIFQTQLSAPKLNKWLSDQFNKHLGIENTKITVVVRESNKPVKKIEVPQTLKSTPTISQAPSHTEPTIKPVNENKYPEGIFYEVYKQLPPNADPAKLKVFPSPLPMPKINENWDDHAGELFDFED